MERNTPSPESTIVSSKSWIIDTILLTLLILLFFLLFMCYLMPSLLYNASGFLQPSSIKKCVDYFDVLLIIIAISSHLLSRYGSISSGDSTGDGGNRIVTSQVNTYSSKERSVYDARPKFEEGGGLRRSSNSYPDLRSKSLWGIEDYGFFDGFDADMYRPVQVADRCSCARHRRKKKVDSSVKEIPVDDFVLHKPTSPKSPPPLSPEDSVPVQTYEIRDQKIRTSLRSTDIWNFTEESMSKRCGMTKSSSTNDLATIERKRKQKMGSLHSRQNKSSLSVTMESETSAAKVPQPPPPPSRREINRVETTVNSASPPRQRSVFNNLFKKGNASKRFQSIKESPQPPFQAPSSAIKSHSISERLQLGSETKRFNSISYPPSFPLTSKKMINYNVVHTRLLPPPPPLSELELAEEMNSTRNQRATQPSSFGPRPNVEGYVNSGSSTTTTESTTRREVSSWILSSPDVNLKADSFIAKLRGEWETEMMNSLEEGENPGT